MWFDKNRESISGVIQINVEGKVLPKVVTHITDFEVMFREIDIESFWLFLKKNNNHQCFHQSCSEYFLTSSVG